MQTASAQPAAVLDYAPLARRSVRLRCALPVIVVVACTLLCGAIGWVAQPVMYRASVILIVEDSELPRQARAAVPLDVQTILQRRAAAVATLASPANVAAAIAQLNAQGIVVTPAHVAARLKVQTVEQSLLVQITFDHPNPTTAAAVANAIVSNYGARGIQTIAMATPPARPQRNLLFPVGGLAIGLLLGVFIVALRWK